MIIHDLEQRSPEWFALRAGMPTASEFGKLVTSKGDPSKQADDYALKLAGELYAEGPIDDFQSDYMERGSEMEGEARDFYGFLKGVSIDDCGFITDDDKRMGCSPDGLIGDDGMLEIKCLKAENHIKAIVRFRKDGSVDPKYIPQTQGQMIVAERAWCDLVFYHPGLPPLAVRQFPKPGFAEALNQAVNSAIAERDRVLAELNAFAPKAAAA